MRIAFVKAKYNINTSLSSAAYSPFLPDSPTLPASPSVVTAKSAHRFLLYLS